MGEYTWQPSQSRVHLEDISGWSPTGPLVSGIGNSLAFTILTGLAEHLVFPLPSAFRACNDPHCLLAKGHSHDFQHSAPMLTRCGNSALRDMAYIGISPIDANKPHKPVLLVQQRFLKRRKGPFPLLRHSRHGPPIIRFSGTPEGKVWSSLIGQAMWKE
jgi:hypothetical protein